jgi:cyclophilin family peptidyl-prolyl cis-trans isomerase
LAINPTKEGEVKSIAYIVLAMLILLAFTASVFATEGETKVEKKEKDVKNPMVVLQTNHGDITLELFAEDAPLSVENFLMYVKDGFYDGTTFHRVVKGFVLQAGGINEDMDQKKQKAPIKNEATNGLKNLRGTLSMARTSDINSGTSHFFINLVDNRPLDHRGMAPAEFGYAVFGKVADDASMKVVDEIAKVKVTTKGMFQNVPREPVMIEKAYVMSGKKVEKKTEAEVKAEVKKEVKKEQKQMKED